MTAPHRSRIADLLLIGAFIVGLGWPAVGLLRHQDADSQEQRLLAPFPTTSSATIYRRAWRRAVDTFVDDRFGGRSALVALNSQIAVRLFRSSPKLKPVIATAPSIDKADVQLGTTPDRQPTFQPEENANTGTTKQPELKPAPPKPSVNTPLAPAWPEGDVVIGKDGWMYFDQEGAIDDYRCRDPFTTGELDTVVRNVTALRDHLQKRGIALYIIIAPEKPSIYPEYLPDTIKRLGTVCRNDQAIAAIRDRTTVPIVDPRGAIIEGKRDGPVFAKTDSHWNDPGAFTAYRQLLAVIQRRFPDIEPLDWSDFDRRTVTMPGLDLAALLSLQKKMKEETIRLVRRTPNLAVKSTVTFADPNPNTHMNPSAWVVPDSTQPRLLVLRDSFSNALLPYLAETFSRTAAVWTYAASPDILEAEKPDIVVLEVVQRKLEEAFLKTKLTGN